jgi:hypothetical protein
MSKKMGRPKVPKAKLRDILVQARFSREEYQRIRAPIENASESKSEWIRKALLSVAESFGCGEPRTRNPGL